MNNRNSSKQVLLSVIGIAILVVAVVGVSFAFFNYTRTGGANTVSTGQIAFTSSQTNMAIDNVFPISGTPASDDVNVVTATVTIAGDTTYANGLDYRISAQNVDFTVGTGANTLDVPVKIDVTATGNLGDVGSDDLAGGNVTEVKLTSYSGTTVLSTGDLFAQGHIAPANPTSNYADNRINGTITIKAYLDASQIAITDTLVGDTDGTGNGTTTEWLDGRTRLTTAQWNTLATDALTFNIRVEAVEGGGGYDLPLVQTP